MTKKMLNQNTNYDQRFLDKIEPKFEFSNKPIDRLEVVKKNNVQYLDPPYTRFEGKKEQQETFFIKDPHGNILELKTLKN